MPRFVAVSNGKPIAVHNTFKPGDVNSRVKIPSGECFDACEVVNAPRGPWVRVDFIMSNGLHAKGWVKQKYVSEVHRLESTEERKKREREDRLAEAMEKEQALAKHHNGKALGSPTSSSSSSSAGGGGSAVVVVSTPTPSPVYPPPPTYYPGPVASAPSPFPMPMSAPGDFHYIPNAKPPVPCYSPCADRKGPPPCPPRAYGHSAPDIYATDYPPPTSFEFAAPQPYGVPFYPSAA